jgi:hypothetical protein
LDPFLALRELAVEQQARTKLFSRTQPHINFSHWKSLYMRAFELAAAKQTEIERIFAATSL